LDSNPQLSPEISHRMCEVITKIEKEYKKAPPLEFINIDVFNILVKEEHMALKQDKKN
jgi:hypothetical protein